LVLDLDENCSSGIIFFSFIGIIIKQIHYKRFYGLVLIA
jgi:hypothetical protein